MCRRYSSAKPIDLMRRVFKAQASFNLEPRWNIATAQMAPVVSLDASGQRRISLMKWGALRHWNKDIRDGAKCVNARSETAAKLPTFRDLMKTSRCLVPANGWYEWTGEKNDKQPWRIEPIETVEGLFAFPGIWNTWQGPEGPIDTYAMLTSEPGSDITHIHDRQPAVLPPEHWDVWMDPASDRDELLTLVKPSPPGSLRFFPVDRKMGSYKVEGPEVALPIELPAAAAN